LNYRADARPGWPTTWAKDLLLKTAAGLHHNLGAGPKGCQLNESTALALGITA
jgi:hypothetical protein